MPVSTKRSIVLLLMPAVLLVQVALGQEPPAPTKREKLVKKLRIEVSAKDSGAPLGHATVNVSSADGEFEDTSPTGSDGSVTFSSVPSGKVRLRVRLTGWNDFGNDYDLAPQDKVTIPIHLQKKNNGPE